MRIGLVVVACGLVTGCTRERTDPAVKPVERGSAEAQGAGATAAPPPKRPPGHTMAAGHAPVKLLTHQCFHSDQPFGQGSQRWSTVIDLAAGTATYDSEMTKDDQARDGRDRSHSTATVDVARLKPFVDALDRGGFIDEYPVPEGISCTLIVTDASNATVLRVEKQPDAKSNDAVVQLIHALPGPPPAPTPPAPPSPSSSPSPSPSP